MKTIFIEESLTIQCVRGSATWNHVILLSAELYKLFGFGCYDDETVKAYFPVDMNNYIVKCDENSKWKFWYYYKNGDVYGIDFSFKNKNDFILAKLLTGGDRTGI